MACVGRQRVCNVVPPNHFGPIPGVEVGTLWKFRVQVGICFFIKCLKILFAEGRAFKTFYPSIRFFFFSFIKYLFRDVNFFGGNVYFVESGAANKRNLQTCLVINIFCLAIIKLVVKCSPEW